ncbi:DNA polymerase IV [Desulfoplanes sp.]
MIMHLDMDAFFASVEQADNPKLRGCPVIIGTGKRAVASTCSYEARGFGVRSGMPLFEARGLCPQGIFLPGRRSRYQEVSRAIFAVLGEYSPLVQRASIDEGYLDISGTQRLFGPPLELAKAIQERIEARFALTCSIGVAPVKFLAKIASDWKKPRGITIISPEDVPGFLAILPVSKIPGVGPKTLAVLERLGVGFASQILGFSKEFWIRKLGKHGRVLYDRAHGLDDSPVVGEERRKSYSCENTLGEDTRDMSTLVRWLLAQSTEVGRVLRAEGIFGRTITLKLKFDDFSTSSRSRTLAIATNSSGCIFREARGLLQEKGLPRKVRLIGVGLSHFGPYRPHLPIGEDPARKRSARLDAAVDAVSRKFGPQGITPATLLGDTTDQGISSE